MGKNLQSHVLLPYRQIQFCVSGGVKFLATRVFLEEKFDLDYKKKI